MEDKIESLRRKYQDSRRGEEDALALVSEVSSVLEEARNRGDRKTVEEVEDMLIDLRFLIEENKCKCHRKISTC